MSDMKDKRGKGILLLGLLINLTACQMSSWQSVSLGNLTPAQFIEAGKPESVRVILSDAPAEPVELIGPVVDGSTLRALDGVTVPNEPAKPSPSDRRTLNTRISNMAMSDSGVKCGLMGDPCSIE